MIINMKGCISDNNNGCSLSGLNKNLITAFSNSAQWAESLTTKHYHLSTFNYVDYEMKAAVFAGEDKKKDIMKIKKMGFLIISHLLKLSRTKAHRFDHLAHSL